MKLLSIFGSGKATPSNSQVMEKLDKVETDLAQLNKNVTDVFFIATEEASKYHESIKQMAEKPLANTSVDTDTMLKSVSAMYVQQANEHASIVAGYKQIITSILMKVGDISLSKELQTICYGKMFTLDVDEDGDAHLGIKDVISQGAFGESEVSDDDEDDDPHEHCNHD